MPEPTKGRMPPARTMSDFRLTKAERLLKRGEFQAVSRQPSLRLRTDHFLLLLRQSPLPHARLGLAVSRKVGSAVARNRVRRRLRECFRHHKHRLPPGTDLIVIASPGAAELDAGATCRELQTGLQGVLSRS
jgi:ribonuclease P protein component